MEAEIPIREIEPHPCRVELVAGYLKLIRAGSEPPPIAVFKLRRMQQGYRYKVAEGSTRLQAARLAGRTTIQAVVIDAPIR
jgi:hypothetical protein